MQESDNERSERRSKQRLERTSSDFENEFNLLNEMFPTAQFTISIDVDEIHDIISTENVIVIQESLYCYCNDMSTKSNLYTIKNMVMTQKNVITELIRQGMTRPCNHKFLTKINKRTDCYFDLWFDS